MPRSAQGSVVDSPEMTPEMDATETTSPDRTDGHPTPEEVAREAYLIYVAHGCEDGHDQEHWYEAERRLTDSR